MISKQGENLVFLLGAARSGTTLLSVMLDSHPSLRCPPEPWLMLALESLGRVSPRSAADAPVLYRALKSFCDPTTAINAAREYASVAYNHSLGTGGKKILVDKTPRYYLILSYLKQVFPRAKYVILWRNPLDIAASVRTTWQVDLVHHLAAGEDHLMCIDLVVGLRRLLDFSKANSKSVYNLKYEQLVSRPQKTFNDLLRWLDVPEKHLAGFELAGGEFDRGDIGDKKILTTRTPHRKSIGRWSTVFNPQDIGVVVNSIGPHLLSAIGYGDVLERALALGITTPDPAKSNSYAQRLEQSLAMRNAEYESAETFSDLTTQERRLHQALLTSTLLPGQPVQIDLLTQLRMAADSAGRLSVGFEQNNARISELEQQGSVAAARLDEVRNLSRAQLEQVTAREAELRSKVESQDQAITLERARVADLLQQLRQTTADHSAQALLVTTTVQQLEKARSTLRLNAAELDVLNRQLHDAEARLKQTIEQRDQLETRAMQAEKILNSQRPVNRRPWPYSIPDSLPLPATLPGGKPWPKISIVTPSFNQGPYIEQTILSILNQNYPNLEYILIDGGSTDGTMWVVNQYADRITCIVNEKDTGQSNAINKGFARATGDLLTWINSDDMLEDGALAAMALAFHLSNADMVAGLCTRHTGGVIANRHLTACASGPLPLDDLLDLEHCWTRGQFFYQPEVMFTRDLWLRAGGHVAEDLYFSMDYELWLRFAEQRAQLHVIGRPVALYRVHEQQKTFAADDFQPELIRVRHQFLQRTGRSIDRNGHSQNGHAETKAHLRVLFFNDLGNVGGAAIAHQRLAAAMAEAGHVVIPIAICPHLTRCELPNEKILQAITDRTPDLIFIGNIHSAQLDPALIGLIANGWPTVQVLHDLYALTGRCAYTGDCGKFITGCDDACPTSEHYPALESSRISDAWKIKNEAMIGDHPPILAAVSNWTEAFAHRRFDGVIATKVRPAKKKSHTASLQTLQPRTPAVVNIRYGLSTDVFKPRDQSTCRDILALPQDRFIVLFSSTNLADRRKGLQHLVDALESLKLPDLLAVCIGQHDADLSGVDFEIRSMGYITEEDSLAMLYSAADVFVGPSEVETFGQVFIEAAACGTPSVGYATAGGVAEAIADGVSGYLAPAHTSDELAKQILKLHDAPALRQELGSWGRLWAESEFSLRASCQRIIAQLNQLGLLSKLHIARRVEFFLNRSGPTEIAWLDVPPPPPTTVELLKEAENRITDLQNDRRTILARTETEIAELKEERDLLQTQSDNRITSLGMELDLLRDQSRERIEALSSEREMLLRQSASEHSQLRLLQADNSALNTHIQNITHTRLWRMVGAIYPIYQRVLSAAFVPATAKLPIKFIANWLGETRDRGSR
jgi:glycosyltransferase involved in cell wall biosynthesis